MRRLLSSALAASVCVLAVLLPGTAAHATVIDEEDIRLTASKADFGGDTFSFITSEPVGDGLLQWDENSVGLRPYVFGTAWLNNSDDRCIQISIFHWFTDGSTLRISSPSHCNSDGKLHGYGIGFGGQRSTELSLISIELRTKDDDPGASWSTIRSDLVGIP